MSDDIMDVSTDVPRRRVLQGLGGAGAVSLAGCIGGGGSDGTSSEVYTEGKLRIAQAKSPIEFDPTVANDVPSFLVIDRMFEGLYAYNEKADKHKPLLAKGQPEVSKGGKRYVVEIKEDAKFQNGDPVTAGDVKYTYKVPVVEETENASEVAMVDTMKAVDNKTIQFDLKYPYAPFMQSLHFDIVPKSERGKLGKKKDKKKKKNFNKKNPIGSGPFKFDSWKEGDYALIKRWDDYWGGQPDPNLKEVRFVPVKEPTTRLTTFKSDKNPVIQNIPPKLWGQVRGMSDAKVNSTPGIGYFYLAFNCNEGPTSDPKVREAIDYAFNMDQAVENFVKPSGVRQYSPLPRPIAKNWDMPLSDWKNIPHDKDLDKAKSMLEDAGVPKDYSWNIIVPPDKKREQIGVTVGNALDEAGWSNVSVNKYSWPKFLKKYITGSEDDYNMYTLGWGGVPDPDSFTYYLFGRTDDTLGVTNGTFWGANSKKGKNVAQKFVTARETRDQATRQKLYQEGITTLLEQRVHLPSYNLKNSYATKQEVHDFKSHAVDNMQLTSNFNNTWVEKS